MDKKREGEALRLLAESHNLKPMIICAEDGELSKNTLSRVYKGDSEAMVNSFKRVRRAIESLIAKETTRAVS